MTNGRADLVLAVDTADDTNAVDATDAKVTIKGDTGRVGIGVSNPDNFLDVAGVIENTEGFDLSGFFDDRADNLVRIAGE